MRGSTSCMGQIAFQHKSAVPSLIQSSWQPFSFVRLQLSYSRFRGCLHDAADHLPIGEH
jgi:hypothetical protein